MSDRKDLCLWPKEAVAESYISLGTESVGEVFSDLKPKVVSACKRSYLSLGFRKDLCLWPKEDVAAATEEESYISLGTESVGEVFSDLKPKVVSACKRSYLSLGFRNQSYLSLGFSNQSASDATLDIEVPVAPTSKIDDFYILGRELGKGGFGSVRLCKSRATGEVFACKTISKGQGCDVLQGEVDIMKHLSGHPGVVLLEGVYEDLSCVHLVMELCPGGDLLDLINREGPFPESRAASLIKELVSILKYCHEKGVMHRDIKPENILLSSSGALKLADFGLATRFTNGQNLSSVVGTPTYVAPEVLRGNYSEKADIYSVGVTLVALLSVTSLSAPALDLIQRMLTVNVSLRATAKDVLRHPWLLSHTEQEHPSKRRRICAPSTAARHDFGNNFCCGAF